MKKTILSLFVSNFLFFGFTSAESGLDIIFNFFDLISGVFGFLLFGIKSIFSLVWKLIVKLFSLSEWDFLFEVVDNLSLYLGDYAIIILGGLMLLMLISFFKFIIRLFKGGDNSKK